MAAGPIEPGEFARHMSALGPYEAAPHIAVACSGGPDSMALALLADAWARPQGGHVTALTVDHGLRPEAAAEAGRVRGWLADAGVDAVVLKREGPRPHADIQAAARRARYALMRRWCRENGVLHLLLGHHLQDQAETLMLRLARGSGVDGLSAMAPVMETAEMRLLRPLLDVPRERLLAYLESAGRPFVTDPSNEDRSFARVRMRDLLPELAPEGLTAIRIARTADRMARARAALDEAVADLLSAGAAFFPEGYATIRLAPLRSAPVEVGLRAVARLVTCIGGNEYTPRMERLERLHSWLRGGSESGGGRTLAGCRIVKRRDTILVCREASAMQPPVAATPGALWDNRFRLSVAAPLPVSTSLGALGREGWAKITRASPDAKKSGLPAMVRYTLPALWVLDDLLAVPHLNYRRDRDESGRSSDVQVDFRPARALTSSRAFSCTGFT